MATQKNKSKANEKPLMQIEGLHVRYNTRIGQVSAIDNVTFEIEPGEILGLVGESGSGKSTLGKALLNMLPSSAGVDGKIILDDENILDLDYEGIRDLRGRRVSMIFQDPMTSLNPVQRINQHLLETLDVHKAEDIKENAIARIKELLERLGIQKERIEDYPHQLSGGMRQRVMIGLGLVLNANLIVADEATTSLDVIVEAKLLDQLREIQKEYGVSIIVITHNIALIAELADRVAVMYAGRLAELGTVEDIFDRPLHPYSQGLLKSVPNIQIDDEEELYRMPGETPSLIDPPKGCRFHPRCPEAMPICADIEPSFEEARPKQWVNCWLYQDHPDKPEQRIVVKD
jgi:oligopeptide/dipeptide ABC transporter ATP-binding protein